MQKCMLTTFDNPYNPFEQFASWFLFDVEKGYNTCAYLGRIARTSDQLTEEENNKLFLSVGTCLHSILDYADRVKIEKKDEKLVSAFRYANNSLKHCIEVKDITKQKS